MRKQTIIVTIFSLLLISSSLLLAYKKILPPDDHTKSVLEKAQQGEIKDPLLIDSIASAIEFATSENEIKWHNGDFFYIDLELPAFRRLVFGYEEVDSIIRIPIEERKFLNDPMISIIRPSLGYKMYQKIIELISAQRKNINFLQLYQNNKQILHKALPKEVYHTKYSPIVNILLRAYTDIEHNPNLMTAIECIMAEHEKSVYEGNIDAGTLSAAYEEIKKLLPQETLDNYITPNPISVMWCYPFWLRRMQENKTEEIYNTLIAIQSDYESL